jgi:glycosyltransferase involved in cell wall biosynthesis
MGQFARLLPDFDWDVTVLTADHAGSALDTDAEARISERARIVSAWSPSSHLVKRGSPVHKRGARGLARRIVRTAATSLIFPDREVFWIPGAIRVGRRVLAESKHDVIVATYGPASNLIVGRALASATGIPLVVDFRDLWSTLPMPVFPTPLHRAAAATLEHSIVRSASRLIAVAPAMARDLATTHAFAQEHAISITNGFDPADAARVHDTRSSGPRPFRLMYSGTVHVHYNLEPLWLALRALAREGAITPETFRVEFVGNLAMSDVRAHGLEPFVESKPLVPHDQVFAELARADALLVVETAGYYARYGYAAKVFDYVLTGKPVVGLVDVGSNTEQLLRAAGVGYCVPPEDASGLEAVLRSVLALKGATPRPVDAESLPLREFNRRHLVAKLAAVLDDVVDHDPRRTVHD